MKAQIAVYAVLGVLILVVAGLVGYIFYISSYAPESSSFDSSAVEFMIGECIKKVGGEGLFLLGKNGNYVDVPAPLAFEGASYWVVEHANVMPVLNSSALPFQVWFNKKLAECVDYSGYQASAGRCISSISYGADSVSFDVFYPVNLTLGWKTKHLSDFHEVVNVRYRRAYERARDIVNAHFKEGFDYRDALNGVERDGFGISYKIVDEDNLVFSIAENEFVFSFATNLGRSRLMRAVSPDLLPYNLFSPDKKAVVSIFPSPPGKLFSWVDYSNDASANVATSVSYTVKGGSVSSSSKSYSDLSWVLSYPVYVFGPENTVFSSPQVLTIRWDDAKNPNLGPVGLLYKGLGSQNKWIPIPAFEDYQKSSVSALIGGFSEYTIVDCARQSCKKAEVSAASEPKNSKKCMFQKFFEQGALSPDPRQVSAEDLFMAGVLMGVASPDPFSGSITLQLNWVTSKINNYVLHPYAYKESETAVSFVPTCDQVVVVECIAGSRLKHGSCSFNGEYIASGSSREFTVEGGVSQALSASASECESSRRKCNSCSVSAEVSYK